MEGGVEEKAMDNEQADRDTSREEYKSEGNEVYHSRYSRETKKSTPEKEKNRKSTSKKGRLESIVNSLTKEARASGIDETEYLGAHLHENISEYLEESNDSEEKTYEGAVAIITNGREFLIEENPSTYGVKEARGKLRLIGGQKEAYDSSTFETEAREIDEEFLEPAKSILLKYLKTNGTHYDTITNIINGNEVKSDILEIHVSSAKDWEIARKAQSTHDAGPFHVLTYDEIWSKPDSAFAFNHGPVIKKFILEELINKNSNNSFYTSNYNFPSVSTNYNHLQTINSVHKPFISKN